MVTSRKFSDQSVLNFLGYMYTTTCEPTKLTYGHMGIMCIKNWGGGGQTIV